MKDSCCKLRDGDLGSDEEDDYGDYGDDYGSDDDLYGMEEVANAK